MAKQLRRSISLNETAEVHLVVARVVFAALDGTAPALQSESWVVRRALALLALESVKAMRREARNAAAAGGESAATLRRAELRASITLALSALEEDDDRFKGVLEPVEQYLSELDEV